MTQLEDRLRDAFTAATQTVRPEAIRPMPRRAPLRRAPRLLIPLAAAASVATVVTAVALIVPAVFSGSHPAGPTRPTAGASQQIPSRPAPRSTPPIVMPRFFADLVQFASSTAGPLQIRAATTGRLVAQDSQVSGSALAGLPGGREFVVAAVDFTTCQTTLSRFRIAASGQPGPLTRLPGPPIPGQVTSMAASANARVLGFSTMGCVKNASGSLGGDLGVVDLATGQLRQWAAPDSGGTFLAGRGQVSFTADGRLLAYQTITPGSAPLAAGRSTSTFWVLPTSAAPGPALTRSRVIGMLHDVTLGGVRYDSASSGVISADGGQMYACLSPADVHQPWAVAAYDSHTRALRLLTTLPGGCSLSSDPASGYLLAWSGSGTGPASLRVTFHLAWVYPPTGAYQRLTATAPNGAMSSIVTGMIIAWSGPSVPRVGSAPTASPAAATASPSPSSFATSPPAAGQCSTRTGYFAASFLRVCPGSGPVGTVVRITLRDCDGPSTPPAALVFIGPKAYVGAGGAGDPVGSGPLAAGGPATITWTIPAAYTSGGKVQRPVPVTPGSGYEFATYPAAACSVPFTVTH